MYSSHLVDVTERVIISCVCVCIFLPFKEEQDDEEGDGGMKREVINYNC